MTKIVANPCYGVDGKIVDIDLDEVVLHTVTGERMTEAFFERLAIEAEDEQNAVAGNAIVPDTVFSHGPL
ncbi:hypothetical protein FACS189483_04200 [Spirochaetia bacterium]|nr:hypothetical protein FACS189483_04200 [Spirochaetia bacterium]